MRLTVYTRPEVGEYIKNLWGEELILDTKHELFPYFVSMYRLHSRNISRMPLGNQKRIPDEYRPIRVCVKVKDLDCFKTAFQTIAKHRFFFQDWFMLRLRVWIGAVAADLPLYEACKLFCEKNDLDLLNEDSLYKQMKRQKARKTEKKKGELSNFEKFVWGF